MNETIYQSDPDSMTTPHKLHCSPYHKEHPKVVVYMKKGYLSEILPQNEKNLQKYDYDYDNPVF